MLPDVNFANVLHINRSCINDPVHCRSPADLDNCLRMSRAFLLLALLIGAHSFHIKEKSNSKNHQDITSIAILPTSARAPMNS